ncbi:MAG: signal peptidase II [Candidatus Omnitrophica bacterium CG11_big_fil_rev_8_21_14_0_20_63_9]|nr:MAG: signal peptidase II [Candidatus Omnitrophica bacterium CG11_big_fil_rev_8_21_14_0_20_63_9]
MWPWLVSGLVLAADQLTKAIVLDRLPPSEPLPVLPPVLYFTYIHNTGAAFGLFKGQQLLFIIVSLAVIAWMGWELAARAKPPLVMRWGCALVLGGAIGNLIDRLRFGYVVDFIDLRVWPVFNIGDSAITIGVGLLLLHAFRRRGA